MQTIEMAVIQLCSTGLFWFWCFGCVDLILHPFSFRKDITALPIILCSKSVTIFQRDRPILMTSCLILGILSRFNDLSL